jgi:chromosome segregation ATPase
MSRFIFGCFLFGAFGLAILLSGCGVTGSTREYAKGLVEDLKVDLDQRFRKFEADISSNRRRVEGFSALQDEIAALRTLSAQERVELKADLDRLGMQLAKLQAQLIILETRFGAFKKALMSALGAQRAGLEKALFELEEGHIGGRPEK